LAGVRSGTSTIGTRGISSTRVGSWLPMFPLALLVMAGGEVFAGPTFGFRFGLPMFGVEKFVAGLRALRPAPVRGL
jgi:hypothetical protein